MLILNWIKIFDNRKICHCLTNKSSYNNENNLVSFKKTNSFFRTSYKQSYLLLLFLFLYFSTQYELKADNYKQYNPYFFYYQPVNNFFLYQYNFFIYNLLYSNYNYYSNPIFQTPFFLLLNFQQQNPENFLIDTTIKTPPPFAIDDSTIYPFSKYLDYELLNRYSPDHPKSDARTKMLPQDYRRKIDIDSNASKLKSNETFFDRPVGYDYEIPIDEYLAMRKKVIQNGIWDSLMNRYDLSAALSGGDIARMLASSTGLTIPIPPNPIISLFGKPEISINVNGEVNLRVGWRWDSQNLGTVSAFGQSQSSPIFSQDIRVNVSGRIGDKFKIGTDWNTRRQFEYDNKFKVSYEGEDDEIIKLIEVGNVSLPTTSSLISGGQALFGVRADFQFGPLYLKTIGSQKRGERKFVNVKGGTSRQHFQIRAYEYAKNHFFLDTAYKAIYNEYFKHSTPVIPASSNYYRVKEIYVWESTGDVRDGPYSSNSVAIADLEPKMMKMNEQYDQAIKHSPIQSGVVERANFLKLDSSRYKYNPNLGTLTIHNLRLDRTYAVNYRIEGATTALEDDLYYGTFNELNNERDTMILKLIYRPNLQPGFSTLWKRQMKNIYSINATNVNVNDTEIGIWYINKSNDSSDVLPGASDKLVSVLRVDQVNNSTGATPPDGKFDLKEPFFNAVRGEITFPSAEPFRQGLIDYFEKIGSPQVAQQYIYGDVYDTTYDVARKNTARDRFIISGEVTGTATNTISLGAYNLSPGSVKVTLDGVTLREYEDYVVDYYSGRLTLRNPRATLPNANLNVEYEANDVFNLTTKTLLGVRGDYELFKSRDLNANLGFTFMYYDQAAIVDRVRLGEEPVANSMLGFDAKLNWDTPWLTKLLDNIPFYDTKAPSSMGIRGEWAMILPEPNKRTSDVASDNNEPVVYVDDFEGAQRYISLGLSPYQWQHCSQPEDSSIAFNDLERAKFRGKTFWYQYFIARTPIKEVYPERSTVQGRSNLSPLHINFNPYERGIYNKNPEFLDRRNPNFDSTNVFSYKLENKEKIWGGFMKLFSSFTTNFDSENIEYIEIMMKIDQYEPGLSKMYIDIGQISEDIIPNQSLDTEDGITAANPMPNNIIDAGEDVGIDAWDNLKEKEEYPSPLNLEDDPSRDDYKFDFAKDDDLRYEEDFINYNNFEGNASISEMGQFPDTEILNSNNGQTIALDNSYFQYEVNLVPDPNNNTQIVGGGSNGWYLYRIPIRDPKKRVGNPLFSNIQYIRVWFKGGSFKASIAEWRLLGSNWQRVNNLQNVPTDDSVIQVSFVNIEENSGPPDYYTMPPGVSPPKQLNNPDPNQIIKLNEQSLAIKVKNLRYGEERMAVRFFQPLDIFYYSKLKVFLHGDGSMPENMVAGAVPKAYAFMRFGTDSSNYYEYRRPLLRDWDKNTIEIELSALTAIKQIRDTLNLWDRQVFPVPNDPLAYFAIRGNPVLTRIQFFGFGIANPAERYPNELTTTMWIDELRLLSPEDRADWSGVANFDVKLADLGNINASFSHSRPNFHMIENRFGNRVSTTNWTVTVQGNLEKFAPASFSEMKVPITFTHAEYMENPEYVANNDIKLEEAAESARRQAIQQGFSEFEADEIANNIRLRSQTLRIQDSWALTGVRLGIPSSFWLVNQTINRITFGYSYSQEFLRSPLYVERFNWIWQFTTQYGVQIPDILSVNPTSWLEDVPLIGIYNKLKINILPISFNYSFNLMRRRTTEQSRYLEYPSPVYRDFSAQQQAQLNWKLAEGGFFNPTIDYSVTTRSTLVPLELDEFGKQRTGSEIAALMFFNNGKLIDLGRSNQHTQNLVINFKPRLPLGDLLRFFDMTGSFNTNYSWQDPLQTDLSIADAAKSAGFQNNIRINTSFKLKSFGDMLFGASPSNDKKIKKSQPDTTTVTTTLPSSNVFKSIGNIFKFIFFDYDKFDINFTQNNTATNPGVYGGTGMTNFWARGLIFQQSEMYLGPSFPYQLGLVSNPHGGYNIESSSKFPFFSFSTYPGLRPKNSILQDNFSQKTSLELKTSRPLWEGATLELTWKSELGYNRNQTVISDSLGIPTFTNIVALESFNRTYLTFPSFFGLNVFNNTIEHVIDLYNEEKTRIQAMDLDTLTKNSLLLNALSESFHSGMEAFSIFGGKVGKFLPAINWGIRWEGIEKWGIWGGIAKKISFEHLYSTKYTESAQITDNGRAVQSQQIQYGFQPLFGITMSFDEKELNGLLTATLKYNSTSQYQLSSSNRSTITRQATDEIQAQASYTLKGFEFPLFDLILKNDIEFSFTGSFKKNRRSTYDVLDYAGENGRTLDGNTQITLEPRVRYSMSNRITASFFIRYEGTYTEGASTPGYNTVQTGLDIRISIAGGR